MSIHAEYSADGALASAQATTTDGHQLELVISDSAATFSEDEAQFLTLATTTNRNVFVADLHSATCWLRYEVIPYQYANDGRRRPLAASRSVPGDHAWTILEAATGYIDRSIGSYRLYRADASAIAANPRTALVTKVLAGSPPDLSPETHLSVELAKADLFADLFRPSTTHTLLTKLLWWCLGGEVVRGSGGAPLGCFGGALAAISPELGELDGSAL